MRLSELQGYVRTQTETTDGELPDSTINLYLQEAFNRTVAAENRWPLFQQTWTLTLAVDTTKIVLPGDVHQAGIVGLFSKDTGHRLELRDHTVAQQFLGTSGGTVYTHFSIWAGELHLWPESETTVEKKFLLHGFRRPTDWIDDGGDPEPDLDTRLHQALCHYAIALAYAQQEDEQLEASYMQRWQRDVELARAVIMEPAVDRPLVMGRQHHTAIGNARYRAPVNVVAITPPA